MDIQRRRVFMLDAEMIEQLYLVDRKFFQHLEGISVMHLLRAMSDYCFYGRLRKSHMEDPELMNLMETVRDRLDTYIEELREAGIAPQNFIDVEYDDDEQITNKTNL